MRRSPSSAVPSLFVTENSWAKDVKYILNFEYRGTTGKSLFFEGASVNKTCSARTRPASLHRWRVLVLLRVPTTREQHRLLDPQWLGAPGLAFASIGNNVRYHTPTDDLTNFSPGALQYTGDMLLRARPVDCQSAVVGFGPEQELVWFTVGPVLISYPTAIAYLLLIVRSSSWCLPLSSCPGEDDQMAVSAAACAVVSIGSALIAIVSPSCYLPSSTGSLGWHQPRGCSTQTRTEASWRMVTFVIAVSQSRLRYSSALASSAKVESLQVSARSSLWAVLVTATVAAPHRLHLRHSRCC